LGGVDVGSRACVVARYRDGRVTAEEDPRALVAGQLHRLAPVPPGDQHGIAAHPRVGRERELGSVAVGLPDPAVGLGADEGLVGELVSREFDK